MCSQVNLWDPIFLFLPGQPVNDVLNRKFIGSNLSQLIFFCLFQSKCILSYKYCLILLRKIITGFVTLITGEPVDQVENKKICMPQIYLATHNRKPFVDICYGLREKRLRRVVLVKKKLPNL